MDVERAVHSLYYAANEADRQSAMRWLEIFQNSKEAWDVSLQILAGNPCSSELTFFAAQTLKHKVTFDFSQQDDEAIDRLHDFICACAFKSDCARVVKTQLVLCLAALYAQCRKPLSLDLALYRNDYDGFLEFLAVLPEQLNNKLIHIPDEQYAERKETLLRRPSPSVLPLFLSAIQKPVGVVGLQNWVRFADLSVDQAIHIVQVAIHLLSDSEDSEQVNAASEMICDISYEQRNNRQVFIEAFYPMICHICDLLNRHSDSSDYTKAVGGMLVESSELYLTELLQHPPTMNILIPTILQLSAAADMAVVELTFNFWSALESNLEGAGETREAFLPVYCNLFALLLPKLQFPPEQTAEERDAFRDFRHIIGDTLKDCVRVVGSSESLSIISRALQQAQQLLPDWQPTEAVLFGLRTIASVIDRRESEVLPGILSKCLTLTFHSRLVYSTLLIIGCLSDWIRYHQSEFLADIVQFVTAGLSLVSDPMITAAAATAMRYLCESCGEAMLVHWHVLHDLYQHYCFSLSRSDQLALTESLCQVIIQANVEKQREYLKITRILLSQMDSANGELVDLILEHLAIFIEYVVPDSTSALNSHHPMIHIYIHEVEPKLEGISQRHGRSIDDGLASLMKAVVVRYPRTLGVTWLRSFTELAIKLLSTSQFPSQLLVLRYLVIMGCDQVQDLIISCMSNDFDRIAAINPHDVILLLTAISDYWRQGALLFGEKSVQLILMIIADPSTPSSDLSSAISLATRMISQQSSQCDPLIVAILQNCINHFPSVVQSDVAVMFHRLSRSVPIDSCLQNCLVNIPALSDRERFGFVEQWKEAVSQPRPKQLKAVIVNLVSMVRRRSLHC